MPEPQVRALASAEVPRKWSGRADRGRLRWDFRAGRSGLLDGEEATPLGGWPLC